MSKSWKIIPQEWMASDGQGAGRWRLVAHRPCCPEEARDLCQHLHESRELAWQCSEAREAERGLVGRK